MAAKRLLPETSLTCRNGHVFTSRARGGQAIDCPACKRASGQRVRVWVPVGRPKTERDLAARSAPGGAEPGRELADRWDREPEWNGQAPPRHGRAGDQCPECGGQLMWEPGRTLTFCRECKRVRLPAAVAGHYERRAQAEVAVRDRDVPSRAAVRTERVQARALAQRMADQVNEWIDRFDPDGLERGSGAERVALDYRAELGAWLPEIRRAGEAGTAGELAEIAAEVAAIAERAAGSSGALAVVERQREAIERQKRYAEIQRERAEREDREARQREHEDREREAREARQRKATATQGRTGGQRQRTITAGSPRNAAAVADNPYARLGVTMRQAQQNRARQLEAFGPCQYSHTFATKTPAQYLVQGAFTQGVPYASSPAVKVCERHLQSAHDWFVSLNYPGSVYTQLKEQPAAQQPSSYGYADEGWARW